MQAGVAPVSGAVVAVGVGDQEDETPADGRVSLSVTPGLVTISVTKEGFVAVQQALSVPKSGLDVAIDLVPTPIVDEEVVVIATTRTGWRLRRAAH